MGEWCPLIKKKCAEHKCAWYIQVAGVDTNSGQEINKFACTMAWLPTLLIENSGQQRQTGAAIESFRNEVMRSNHVPSELTGHLTETRQLSEDKK